MHNKLTISTISKSVAVIFFAIFVFLVMGVMDWNPRQPKTQTSNQPITQQVLVDDYMINIVKNDEIIKTGINRTEYRIDDEDYTLAVEPIINENNQISTNLRISHQYKNSNQRNLKYNTLCSINASNPCEFHDSKLTATFEAVNNKAFHSQRILSFALIWMLVSLLMMNYIFNGHWNIFGNSRAVNSNNPSFNPWLFVSVSMILWVRLYFALILTRIDVSPVHTTFFSCLYLLLIPALISLYLLPLNSVKQHISSSKLSLGLLWLFIILPLFLFVDIFFTHIIFSSELYYALFKAYLSNVLDFLSTWLDKGLFGLKDSIDVLDFKSVLLEIGLFAMCWLAFVVRVILIQFTPKKRKKTKHKQVPNFIYLAISTLLLSVIVVILHIINPERSSDPPFETIYLLLLPIFLYAWLQVLVNLKAILEFFKKKSNNKIINYLSLPQFFVDQQLEKTSKSSVISSFVLLVIISGITFVILPKIITDFGSMLVLAMVLFASVMVLALSLTNTSNKLKSQSSILLHISYVAMFLSCGILCGFFVLKGYTNHQLLTQVSVANSQQTNNASDKSNGYAISIPSFFEPPCKLPDSDNDKLTATEIKTLDECFASRGKKTNHQTMRIYGWLVGQPLNYVYSDLSYGRLQDIERLKSYNIPTSILLGDHYVINPKYAGGKINGYQYEHISSATLSKPFGLFGMVMILLLWLQLFFSIPAQQVVARSFVGSILGISFYILSQSLNVFPFAGNNLPLMVVSSFTRDTLPILVGLIIYLVFSPSIKKR